MTLLNYLAKETVGEEGERRGGEEGEYLKFLYTFSFLCLEGPHADGSVISTTPQRVINHKQTSNGIGVSEVALREVSVLQGGVSNRRDGGEGVEGGRTEGGEGVKYP